MLDAAAITQADKDMGRDLDEIFNMLEGPAAREMFKASGVVIDHQWNEVKQRFH